jgi:hypothetical protein
MAMIRFRFAPAKALAALQWMLERVPGVDLHTALKTCYFADRDHLNKHGRPIFGATYRAMRFGPVPLEIYEMAKGEAIWLAELRLDRYPWRLEGYHLERIGNEGPDLDCLSETDVQELAAAFDLSRQLDFNARTAATHGRDWQEAELGIMRYEDMIDEGPEKSETVAYLQAAPRMRL